MTSFSSTIRIISFLTLSLSFGCIGVDEVDDLVRRDPRIEITSENSVFIDTIQLEEEITYTATYFDLYGRETGAAFTWESMNPEIASINSQGVAKGLSGGMATILATANEVSQNRLIYVSQLERVEISSPANGVLIGNTVELSAIYFDAQGASTGATFSWNSSDPSVASIDMNGTLTGIARGQVTITASANGIESKKMYISVVENTSQVAEIVITSPISIMAGETVQLTAVAKNVNGDEISGQNFSWMGNNNAVLTVAQNGSIKGVEPGLAEVRAETDGISSAPKEIIVMPVMTLTRTGTFQGQGSYDVQGDVTMEMKEDGTIELQFASDFRTDAGPGLYIYLSNTTTGGTDIGKLPQTSGGFTYAVPSGIEIDDYDYVVIWCKPFGVTFGFAQLN